MKTEVKQGADKTVEIDVEGEDISVVDIVHHELLQDEKTVFAGVVQLHPLIKKITLKIQTKDPDPLKAVAASSARAAKIVGEVAGALNKALQEAER